MSKSWRIRLRAAIAGLIVPVALVCGTCGPVAPVAAAEPGARADASIAGGFALGDALEATIDERDGAVRFELPVGGLRLVWDSRDASDAFGLGHGWSFGTEHLGVDGGVRVFPAGGGAYELDRSHPSGLAGVATREVAFRAEPGRLPGREGRPGGAAAPVPYAYVLRQLGGTATFFDEAGDPVARVGPTTRRTDWVWHQAVPRRLLATIDADGVATELDWRSAEQVCVRPGTNLGERDGGDWCVRVGVGGLAVTDPAGGRLDVSQDAAGLVSRISGVSGAHTELSWRPGDDGTARIETVRTMDGSGAKLSSRHWRPTDAAPSGWPGGDESVGVGRQPFETSVSDGATRVVSSYDAARRLSTRRTEVSSGTGERVVQERRFGYPEAPYEHAGRLERAGWPDRPTSVEIGFHDVAGGERTTSAAFVYDELGRVVERPDGTRLAYDQLDRPTRETAPGGEVRAIGYWADGSRRSIDGPSHSVTFYWDDDTLVTEAFTRPGVDDAADVGTGAGTEVGAAVYLIGADRHARTTVTAAGASRPSTSAGTSAGTSASISTQYYTHDRHGTVTELTDTSGDVTHAYSYSDYGRTTEHLRPGIASDRPLDRNPFRYAGEYTDVPGTQWLATRTYDAEHARFEQPDPTARHNRYAFGDADPITNVDPSGHVAVNDLVNGFTAAAGIVFGALAATSAALTPGWIATVGFFGSRGFLAATGFVADVVGLGVAAVQFVDDHAKRFLPRYVKTGLTYAEYGLMGIGAVGAVAGSLPDLVREVGQRRGPPELDIADQLDAYVKDRTDKLTTLRRSETYRWYRSHFTGFGRDDLAIADVGTPDIEGSSALGRDLLSFGQRSAAIRRPDGGLIANIPATWVEETTEQLTNLEQRIASARSAIVARLSVADSAGRAKGFQFTESLEHHTMVKRALFTLQEAETSYLALQDLLGLRRLTEERATTLYDDR